MRLILNLMLAAACALSTSSVGYACTIAGKSLPKFDPNEYVFIGQVVGFTELVDFDEREKGSQLEPMSSTSMGNWPNPRKTVGIKVRMTEAVHVPRKPAEYFEIYVYDLGADCSIRGSSLVSLKSAFPEGSEVRVISRDAIFVTNPTNPGTIRLEDRPGEMGSIALNTLRKGERMTTATSVFDYKSYSYDMNRDTDSKYLLPSFELRKDLVRLESSRSPVERRAILKRLFDLPVGSDLDLKSAFDTYAASQQEADELYDSYLRQSDPEFYELHKVLKRVTDELLKLGYRRKEVDEAIMKAIEGGCCNKTLTSEGSSKLSYDDLLRESVKVLKSPK